MTIASTIHGLREGALTLAYNTIIWARNLVRHATRPTEMGVRALVLHGDTVLLVRHRGGRRPWSLPGGGIDPREPLDAAAIREVREEGGCPVRIERLLGLYHAFGQGTNNYIGVFVCAPMGPAAPPQGDLEIVDARFFPIGDLPANTEAGSLRRIAEHGRGETGIYGEW